MRVLIANGGFVNKGAEALLYTVLQQISKRVSGDISFYLENRGKPIIIEGTKIPDNDHKLITWRSKKEKLLELIAILFQQPKNIFLGLLNLDVVSTINKMEGIDVLIDISGFAYSDHWGQYLSKKALGFSKYIKRNNGKCIYLPQAWGPFTKKKSIKIITQLYKNSKLIYARDEISASYLSGTLSLQNGVIPIYPDIAFLFEGEKCDIARIEIENIFGSNNKDKLLIGISPNMRVYERANGKKSINEYIIFLKRAILNLEKEFSARFLILPHEIRHDLDPVPDDRYLCRLLAAEIDKDGVKVLDGNMSAAKIKSYIGNLDFLIGSRYHSLIAALSQNIPVASIGWSHKYSELLKLFNLENNVLAYDEKESQLKLINLISNRDISIEMIKKQNIVIRKRLNNLFNEVSKIITNV